MTPATGWYVAAAVGLAGCGADGGQVGRAPYDGPWTSASDGTDPSGADQGTSDDDGADVDDTASSDDDGTPPAGCPGGPAAWTTVVAEVEAYVDAQGGPGAAVAVVCNGQLAHAAGVGFTHASGDEPITETTRFQLASVTKMFTGAAAVALAEQGVVDLHAPVSDVLGTVGYGHVTLHQLLTHTAGYSTAFDVVQSSDLVTVVLDNANQPLWAPAGAVWNYTNPGFSVAGAVLEMASGTDFGPLVETALFEPAGMSRATMHVATVLAEGNYAYGHEGSPAAPIPIAPDGSYYASALYGPQGGAWGSVEDLARWGEMHLAGGGNVLSAAGAASLGEFHTRTADSEQGYGYGVFVESFYDPTVLTHGGSTPGFLAQWRLVPDLQFGVFVVTNSEWVSPNAIADIAMDQYIELGWAGDPPGATVLDDYVGTYTDPYGDLGTITITSDGVGLTAQLGGSSEPMMHQWEDIFTVYHPALGFDINLAFWRGDGAQAQYMVSIWGVGTRS
ncbi:MAG: serine hydrolase [Deltaproteobacteria bacterium]|nr:serine hydrolase [Deltaproteobacteria bacterium]